MSNGQASASFIGVPEREASEMEEQASVDGRDEPLTQEQFDERMVEYIVTEMCPLSLIESVNSLRLTMAMTGNDIRQAARLRVPTAVDLRQMILDKFDDFKQTVKEVFKRQLLVATTCDVWKTNEKTFVAVTAHWIDAETMMRFNCLLNLREICHNPTGETIARILYDVHREFEILGKVAHTTVGGSKGN
jgi:hypothetical protein